ncbi:ABC transporter ATP-binding protein [Magnetofaba australis]|uniref:Putative ABC-type cobalamin/Fe3+-siderophore transport system, ATPase component n=1 Tax=Magnetofaba australis IT-1 TaxID=1434232 RepID=A0A1Y2K1S7_9PROT|nr:ABC transporter ATP-binding protein [Magnetofaba australis]OSM01968.1 putative ABC-type cobalamin/Fe3+-siderophore transport system, ATPase component [Magnetofaba australis IT-1]
MSGGLKVTAADLRIGDVCVCENLTWEVLPGERWAILGRNGVGKSTLLHALAGLRPLNAGSVALQGRELANWPRRLLAQRLGVLFQQSESAFPATVLETALAGRHPHLGLWAWEGQEDYALARRALEAVGLAAMESRDARTLSGGERRRLEIAAVLTQNPPWLLLDEPANHLDLRYQIRILEQLSGCVDESRSGGLAMVLHDVNLALRVCNRFLLLFGDGQWRAGDAAATLSAQTLSQLYDHPMQAIATPGGPLYHPQ